MADVQHYESNFMSHFVCTLKIVRKDIYNDFNTH